MEDSHRIKTWLNNALELERQGMEFYETAAEDASDWVVSDFFSNMVAQERLHIKILEDIARSYQKNGDFDWPDTSEMGPAGYSLKQMFSHMSQSLPQANEDLIEAVEEGLKLENESLNFYNNARPFAVSQAEEKLLSILAEEEREHWQIFTDMLDFYKKSSPAASES